MEQTVARVRVESAFQMTLWLREIGECHEWFGWLTTKGIPVAIVSRQEQPRYSVWRGGKEVEKSTGPGFWRGDYKIVRATSGFLL